MITHKHIHEHTVNINFIGLDKIIELLSHNNLKLEKIMAKIDELNQLVTDLQASVDAHQDKDAATIAALNARIAELQALLDAGDGATSAQIQSVIDGLTATKADIESTPTP